MQIGTVKGKNMGNGIFKVFYATRAYWARGSSYQNYKNSCPIKSNLLIYALQCVRRFTFTIGDSAKLND